MANNYKAGETGTRNWGLWEVIRCGKNFCVKEITVNPGGVLSLQSHQYRSETWTIIEGEAVVIINGVELRLKAGKSVFIPAEVKHRIRNESGSVLKFIEVQTGSVLDENDITRYEDIYGRV